MSQEAELEFPSYSNNGKTKEKEAVDKDTEEDDDDTKATTTKPDDNQLAIFREHRDIIEKFKLLLRHASSIDGTAGSLRERFAELNIGRCSDVTLYHFMWEMCFEIMDEQGEFLIYGILKATQHPSARPRSSMKVPRLDQESWASIVDRANAQLAQAKLANANAFGNKQDYKIEGLNVSKKDYDESKKRRMAKFWRDTTFDRDPYIICDRISDCYNKGTANRPMHSFNQDELLEITRHNRHRWSTHIRYDDHCWGSLKVHFSVLL